MACAVVAGARADDIGVPIEPIRYVNNNHATDSPGPFFIKYDDGLQDLATDGQGVWIAAWTHTWSSNNPVCIAYDLQFARSTDDGMTWTDPAYLNPLHQNDDPGSCVFSPVDSARNVSVVTDRQGNWIIYGDYHDGSQGGDNDIGLWTSSDNGLTWEGPTYLNTDSGSDGPGASDNYPQVVVRDGAWIAVWLKDRGIVNGYVDVDMMFAKSVDAGATWTAPMALFQSGPNDTVGGFTLKAKDSELFLVWGAANMQIPRESHTYHSHSFDGGETWLPPTTFPDEWQVGVGSLALLDNAWILTWNRAPGNFWDVRTMQIRSTTHGFLWSAPVEVAQTDGYNTNGGAGCIIVGDDRSNAFLLCVSDRDGAGALHQHWDTYIMRTRDQGLTWSSQGQPLNSDFADDVRDVVTLRSDVSDDGRFLFAGGRGNFGSSSPFVDTDVVVTGLRLFDVDVVDPNPDLLDGPEVTTDPVLLATIPGQATGGLAADGVTRLLVRVDVSSPGTVDFVVRGTSSSDVSGVGWLAAPGATSGTADYTAPVVALAGGRHVAFAVLHAPREFTESTTQSPDDNYHLATVSATFHPAGGGGATSASRELAVVRPPVVLMHGLWSSAVGAWANSSWPLFYDSRFYWVPGDYCRTNDRRFESNVVEAWHWTRTALERFRKDNGVAATQVDYIGHSMGGILGRMYAANVHGDYFRDNNYGAGDFRKLITVDTPHWGSPVANAIDTIEAAPSLCRLVLDRVAARLKKCLTCGAVADLRTDSAAVAALPAVNVPTHAIVGTGGSDLLGSFESSTPPPFRWLPILVDTLDACGLSRASIFGAEEHDFLVALASQTGGLASPSMVTSFGYDDPPAGYLGIHTSVTNEDRVGVTVLSLLDMPVSNAAVWGSLPTANPSTPSLSLPPDGILRSGLAISSPASGTHVAAGSSVSVTVEATDGFVPTTVQVVSPWNLTTASSGSLASNFSVSVSVPAQAIGPMTLHAFAFDAARNLAQSSDVTILVDVSASVNYVSIGPDPLVLYSRQSTAQLTVTGHYSDGVDRDLTSSAVGTTYWSDNPAVLTVDGEGVVTAAKVGEATVYAETPTTNGALWIRVVGVPLTLSVSGTGPSWTADDEAASYDVVRGDLGVLRSDGGVFTASVQQCLAAGTRDLDVADPQTPAPGQAWYYVLRSRYADARDPGTWDEDGASSRDAGIAASSNTCP